MLDDAELVARVYGSHGWQYLSRLGYVHADSDLDVWLAVADDRQADAAVAACERFDGDCRQPRLDGELMFADGKAYAWREWREWRDGQDRRDGQTRRNGRDGRDSRDSRDGRAGGPRRILAKSIDGPTLTGAIAADGAVAS